MKDWPVILTFIHPVLSGLEVGLCSMSGRLTNMGSSRYHGGSKLQIEDFSLTMPCQQFHLLYTEGAPAPTALRL